MIDYLLYQIEEEYNKIFSSNKSYKKRAEALSTNDLEELQAVLNAHIKRGQSYSQYENWEDAIREFDSALQIHPSSEDALLGSALANHSAWLESGKPKYKFKAAHLARKCVELNEKNYYAMQLLSQIYKSAVFENKMQSNSILTKVLAVLILVMFCSSGYLAYIHYTKRSSHRSIVKKYQQEEKNNNTTNSNMLASNIKPFQRAPKGENLRDWRTIGVEPPVKWTGSPDFEGVNLKVEKSEFKDFKGVSSYNLLADLQVQEQHISRLKLKIELIDKDGFLIENEIVDVLKAYEPTAHTGESIPLRYLHYQEEYAQDIAEVRLHIEDIMYENETEEDKTNTQKVALEWEKMSDFTPNLLLFQTLSNIQETDQDGAFHHLEWKLQNIASEGQIRKLQAQIDWIGEGKNVLDSRTTYLLNNSEPSLKAGQARNISRAYKLNFVSPEDISHYKVTIKTIVK